jgi:hypothetical protein
MHSLTKNISLQFPIVLILLVFSACSDSAIQKNEAGHVSPSPAYGTSNRVTLEGTVKYSYGAGTPEHQGFRGYILEQWHWIAGPMILSGVVRLQGNIGDDHRDKFVRLSGNVPADFTPQSTSVTIQVDSVQILN